MLANYVILKLILSILLIKCDKSTVLCKKKKNLSNQLMDFQTFCVCWYLSVLSYQITAWNCNSLHDLMYNFYILWPKMVLVLQNFQYIKLERSKISAGRTDWILWNPFLVTQRYVRKCGMVTFWVDGPWG